MAGTVIVPWYTTGFRKDGFEKVLDGGRCGRPALRRHLLRRLPLAR